MTSGLIMKHRGFGMMYNGSRTKWEISIDSMVPAKNRMSLSDYYIIVYKSGTNMDRYYFKDGIVCSVYSNSNIPKYVKDIVVDILNTGDMNKYIDGEVLDNNFTRIGRKSIFEN